MPTPAKRRNRTLTAKEERFCYQYVLYLNATQAAISAGYAKHSARSMGCQLLTKLNIRERIEALKNNLAEAAGISALRILKEHEKIAFADAGQLRDGWITLKEFESLSEDRKACIQEVSSRQVKRLNSDGETIIEEWVKVKMYDKQKSLDSIKAMLGFDAPARREITGRDGRPLNPEQISIEVIDKREDVRHDNTDNENIQ